MKRYDVTLALIKASVFYLMKKGYASHVEFGVPAMRGKRLDILALNYKQQFIGIEAKSCVSDYRTDTKWVDYMNKGAFNKFYFVITHDMYDKRKFFRSMCRDIAPYGAGVMILDRDTGYIRVVKNAKQQETDSNVLMNTLVKMAWREGQSRKNLKRRQRIFLE